MHGDTILLMTFVFALVAAFAGGLVARALRLPPIVGYLAGGLVVSPFTPGFIGDSGAMNQLSEVGVMFMMFATGLHFSFKDPLEVKGIAVPVDTPDEVVAYYEELFRQITEDPDFQASMVDLLQPVMYLNAEDFTQYYTDVCAESKQMIEDLGLAYYQQ